MTRTDGHQVPDVPSDFSARLGAVMASTLEDPSARVTGLRRLSGGASRASWMFDLESADGTRALVLRMATGRVPDDGRLQREATAMQAAARVGVPVPDVLVVDGDLSDLGGAFMVMGAVPGETLGRPIVQAEHYAAVRPYLAAECGRLLGRLHSLGPGAVADAPDVDALDDLWALFTRLGAISPTFELAFRWLDGHRPSPNSRTMVHGDFRTGNLVIGPDGVRAVLDWELVHVGDPAEDLGWLCVRAWRFGSALPVGGFGSYESLLAAYEAESGLAIELNVLRWWELFGTLRWGVMCQQIVHPELSPFEPSIETIAIGRRVCEQEYDCLTALRELIT